MPTVSTTITLSIPEGGISLAALEAAVAEAATRAGRDLLLAGCQAMERESLAWSGSSLRHEKRRSVDLLTRFCWVPARGGVAGAGAGHGTPCRAIAALWFQRILVRAFRTLWARATMEPSQSTPPKAPLACTWPSQVNSGEQIPPYHYLAALHLQPVGSRSIYLTSPSQKGVVTTRREMLALALGRQTTALPSARLQSACLATKRTVPSSLRSWQLLGRIKP